MKENNCSIDDNKSSCCSTATKMNAEVNLKEHWDHTYTNSAEEKLGWYETDLEPTMRLITKTGLDKNARMLAVGAGSTTLIDALLKEEYTAIIATDLSAVALRNLKNRLHTKQVSYIVDDLVNPSELNSIAAVDLWIDRAVLHFFTKPEDQDVYFDLLKRKVKTNGFVLLAEYDLNGASRCAGLPVYRYSKEMLVEKLGTDFELTSSFDHTFIMPSGDKRPYIYTLFRKLR